MGRFTSPNKDDNLIIRLKNDDKGAFNVLFRKYWQELFDAAYKRVQSKESAEEIIQDLFLDLWDRRRELQIKNEFSAYIHTSLKYKIFNWYRNQAVRAKYKNDIQNSNREAGQYSLEDHFHYNELNAALEKEIDNMPEKCRRVFILSRKNDLTIPEISRRLNISTSTVEKHIGKALKILRANLKDFVACVMAFIFL